jgi:hypothetical protein
MVVVAVLAAWGLRRRAPAVTFGILWTGVALFPVSNIVVPTSILLAERTLFLATIGAVIAVGGAAQMAWESEGAGSRWARRALAGLWVVAIGLGMARTVERWSVWRDETTYVTRTAQDAPRSFRAQRAYGEVLFLAGQRHEGMAAYGRALQYAPPGR